MTGSKQAGTDERRVSDGADERRREERRKKPRRTAFGNAWRRCRSVRLHAGDLRKTPSSEALGTPAKGAVEGGEVREPVTACPIEMPGSPPRAALASW